LRRLGRFARLVSGSFVRLVAGYVFFFCTIGHGGIVADQLGSALSKA
jgi:hypothetical protein